MWMFSLPPFIIAFVLVEANQLQRYGSCDCSGCDTIILDCTVIGGAATIWQGTIFNECQGRNDILLRHSQFSSGGVINVTCDRNLSISGQAISVNATTSMFTSRLIIDLHEDLSDRTVECADESKGIIGSYMISLEPVRLPPPTLYLIDINDGHLTFSWSHIHSPSLLHYIIDSTNCGVCPNTTTSNYTTCYGLLATTDPVVCSLTVQSVTSCGAIGNKSEPLRVVIEVPEHPVIQLSQMVGQVILTAVIFNEDDFTNNRVAGFTITFTDSVTGDVCVPISRSTKSCVSSVCSVMLNMTSLPCLSHLHNITATVYASNEFGDGPQSKPFTVSLLNTTQGCAEFIPTTNTNVAMVATIIASLGSFVTLVSVVFIIVTIILFTSKRNLQKQVNTLKNSKEHLDRHIYENVKVETASLPSIEAEENVAYAQVSDICGQKHT